MKTLKRQAALILVALVALGSILGNLDFAEPPRFDGAGYATLGMALSRGEGYREISHPDRPRHDHFPPGYPLTLSLLWRLTPITNASAHALSLVMSVLAITWTLIWLRRHYAEPVALGLTLALAVNWVWGRLGGSIQSEPLFFLTSLLAMELADRPRFRSGLANALILGLVLGVCVLIRHVGVALLLAVICVRWKHDRWRDLLALLLGWLLVLAPWVVWIVQTGRRPQTALVAKSSNLLELLGSQTLFYARRIPDMVAGPFIEVATVFANRPALALMATLVGAIATLTALVGWFRLCHRHRSGHRLMGWIPFWTLAILLIWPFTEAGRFLAPLAPWILAGLMEGFAPIWLRIARMFKRSRPKTRVVLAWTLLIAALPYPAYSIAFGRASAQRLLQREFDEACRYLRDQANRAGPVLARHPGDVFWNSGRLAIPIEEKAQIVSAIRTWNAAYLLVDRGRYAKAEPGALEAFAQEQEHSRKLVLVLVWGDPDRGSVLVYEIVGEF